MTTPEKEPLPWEIIEIRQANETLVDHALIPLTQARQMYKGAKMFLECHDRYADHSFDPGQKKVKVAIALLRRAIGEKK